MVKIVNKPILEHIMGIYEYYGYNQLILALGYKSEYIKKYYKNKKNIELVYTGQDTKTGGRLLRFKSYLKNEKTFMLTYGDGVSNINIKKYKLLSSGLRNLKINNIINYQIEELLRPYADQYFSKKDLYY